MRTARGCFDGRAPNFALAVPGSPHNRSARNSPERAVLHAKGAAISRPACGLPHFQQLNAKILHRLQGAVKLSLVSKGSYEDWTGGSPLDTQAERFERSNEGSGQLPAYADLIGKALRARTHDCTVLSWAGSGITPPG